MKERTTVRKARHQRKKNLRWRWLSGANPVLADPESQRPLHWFGPRRFDGLSRALALHKDQPLVGLGIRARKERWEVWGGGGDSTPRRKSSLKCFKGLQTVRMLCVCFEDRNLARNQSTHMLITYSMTKRKQKPHKFPQPLGSQCLLPLINFLELSLSTYLRTWSICQPQETLPAPAVGAW